MRTLLATFALMAALAIPSLASAELLFYRGTETVQYNGEGGDPKASAKVIFIADHANANVAVIRYYLRDGVKRYYVSTLTELHLVEIIGAKKTYSAFVWDSNEEDATVFIKGANASITTPGGKVSFPRTLSRTGNPWVFYADGSGQPVMGQSALTVNFHTRDTAISSNLREDFESAKARVITDLENLGYTN